MVRVKSDTLMRLIPTIADFKIECLAGLFDGDFVADYQACYG